MLLQMLWPYSVAALLFCISIKVVKNYYLPASIQPTVILVSTKNLANLSNSIS